MSRKLYHFTTIDVLQKIIENAQFYAFNIKYSNDHQEFDDGYKRIYKELNKQLKAFYGNNTLDQAFIKVIRNIIDEIPGKPDAIDSEDYGYFGSVLKRSSPEVYFVCFTLNDDSLAQWEMYAKESGVSIEFDFNGYEFVDAGLPECLSDYYKTKTINNVINNDVKKVNEVAYTTVRLFGSTIHDILYDKNAIKNMIARKVASVRDELLLARQEPEGKIEQIIKSCFEEAPLIKGKEHRSEAESRIIVRPTVDDLYDDEYNQISCHNVINHINIGGVLTPYIKVAWTPQDKSKSLLHPIKTVIVGPGWNQDIVYKSVIHYLCTNKERIASDSNKNAVADYVRKWFEKSRQQKNEFMTDAGILVKKSKSSHIFK